MSAAGVRSKSEILRTDGQLWVPLIFADVPLQLLPVSCGVPCNKPSSGTKARPQLGPVASSRGPTKPPTWNPEP